MKIKEVRKIGQVGRPRVDNPKTNRFSICLDRETEEKLKVYCQEHRSEERRVGKECL